VVTSIGWWCGVTEFGVPGCVTGVIGAAVLLETALLAPAAAVSGAAVLLETALLAPAAAVSGAAVLLETALLAPAAAVWAAASLPAAAAAVLPECISSVPEADSSALDPSSG
jgi:hypothetical protein